jgi:hypothetical protein
MKYLTWFLCTDCIFIFIFEGLGSSTIEDVVMGGSGQPDLLVASFFMYAIYVISYVLS